MQIRLYLLLVTTAVMVGVIPIYLNAHVPTRLTADDKPIPKLEGKWEVTRTEIGGKEQKGGGDRMVWEFKDDTATSTTGDTKASFRIERDDKADPKRVNFFKPTGDKELVLRGIYKFDGEELMLVVASAPDDQPGLFQTERNDGRIYFRMKPKK